MRVLVVVLLLLAAGAGVLAVLAGGSEPPLAPAAALPSLPSPRAPQPIAPPEQGSRIPTPEPPPVPEPSPSGAPAAPAATPAATPNVVLAVRGLATREPVPAFRWQFRNSRGTTRGEGTAGRAELALEPAAAGELLVEAVGFAPRVLPGLAAPTPPAGALQLDVFLAPAVPAAGITLFVRDLALQPVAHVRVDTFALPQPPPVAWHLGTSLWARRTGAADGRYVLPPLPPGDYGIRVVATDGDGALLPLLPYRGTFTLTGDNGFVEDVALAPGALLALDLVDAAGAPFDPVRAGTATLRLTLPGGPPVSRKWSARSGDVETTSVDVVPGAGTVLLTEAVEAGQYQLEVAVGGTVRAQRQLFLRPGLRNTERVVVP